MKVSTKQRFVNLGMFLVCVLAVFFSGWRYQESGGENAYNQARVLLAPVMRELEVGKQLDEIGEIQKLMQTDKDVSLFLLNLSGVVTAEQNSEYQVGETLNLSEMIQTDHSFYEKNPDRVKVTFPIEQEGSVTGFAIFLLQKEMVVEKSKWEELLFVFEPVLAGFVLCLILIIFRTERLRIRFVGPMEEIARSAKAIVQGNYDMAVVKNHSTKVLGSVTDQYVYAFELMRDELKVKEERENKLKRAQKELMSCISHDLKTPLSSIKAYGEGIRDGLARDEETRKEYVDTILKKTEVMDKMIKDLLDQTNAEINELSIQKKEQYAQAYLDKTFKELAVLAKQQKVSCEYENKVPDLLVSIDEGRITQVLYNLVENAIKYMDKEERKLKLLAEYSEGQQMLVVTVSDNGPGIAVSDMPFVFDKFYRAEKSRNMSIPGAGLGLSICKYIVQAHGGELKLSSKTGEGCQFTFTLMV